MIAIWQHIAVDEYLRVILGETAYQEYMLGPDGGKCLVVTFSFSRRPSLLIIMMMCSAQMAVSDVPICKINSPEMNRRNIYNLK